MSRGARLAIALAVGALLVPGLGHARIDPTCGRQNRAIYAEITEPGGGKLTVVTDATGPIALDAAGDGVVLSTTGSVPVTISYQCVMHLNLTVTKTAPGAPTVVHNQVWEDVPLNGPEPGPCVEGTQSTTVMIGLDGGQYSFDLSGTGCNGGPLVPSSSGRVVGDPPLGI